MYRFFLVTLPRKKRGPGDDEEKFRPERKVDPSPGRFNAPTRNEEVSLPARGMAESSPQRMVRFAMTVEEKKKDVG